MRVLFLHNKYIYRGGEDESREQEMALLRRRGIEVIEHIVDNSAIATRNLAMVGIESIWNVREAESIRELIRSAKPNVMKVDNYYPLLSPAIFNAAKDMGVPTVLSVRNYRLICPSANIFRNGQICTLCVGRKVALPAVQYRCYHGSYAQSAAVVASNAFSHFYGVWSDLIDCYIAVSEFVKDLLVSGGFPANKIIVKPNFISDSGEGFGEGGYALYVGRLTKEKGISSLLDAWRESSPGLTLKIIGDGPLESIVRTAAERSPRIEYLGRRPLEEVNSFLGKAAMLIFPSVWYEPFGRTLVEAYCKGTPVVASDTPPMRSMVHEGKTGVLYKSGDGKALAAAVSVLANNPKQLRAMRANARARYMEAYTEDHNYRQLMEIFTFAGATHRTTRT